MNDGHHFSHLRSKLQLLSVRFAIVLPVAVFLVYQRTILRHGHLLAPIGKLANKYDLVEKYEQDTLLDVDAPFKRILFWNDVQAYITHFQLSHFQAQTDFTFSVLGHP